MTDEFYFFSNDCNNWNYNPFINTPHADPYNFKRSINISSNNSYNLMKYNAVIMLKEILNHTSQLFRTDETINYKKIRLWFRQNPLYITNSNIDNYPDEFFKHFRK
jgi:hypothetical protein